MAVVESNPGKLFLIAAILAKDGSISNNGKGLLKELILGRDERLFSLMRSFESKEMTSASFVHAVHGLIESEAFVLYSELFDDTSLEVGKTLSKREREESSLGGEKSLIYGEVDFAYFSRILRKIAPAHGGRFYDLGSGTSKAVMVARLLHDFECCVGIEILSSLHCAASAVVDKFNEHYVELLASRQSQEVSVVHDSFLEQDWSDGDVVFANSTCFEDELMEQMASQAERMRPGAYFITFTKGLGSDAFEILERKRYRMSWGPATVFIHMRKNFDGSSAKSKDLVHIDDDHSYNDDDDDDDTNAADDDDATDAADDDATENGAYQAATDDDDDEYDDDDDDDDDPVRIRLSTTSDALTLETLEGEDDLICTEPAETHESDDRDFADLGPLVRD